LYHTTTTTTMDHLVITTLWAPSGPVALDVSFAAGDRDGARSLPPDLETRRADLVVMRVPHSCAALTVGRHMAKVNGVCVPGRYTGDPTRPAVYDPMHLVAAYASRTDWPPYLRWMGGGDQTLATGPRCLLARVLCSSPAMCLCRHQVAFVVDPDTLFVHARITRRHVLAAHAPSARMVDPWTFAVMRHVALSPDAWQAQEIKESAARTLRLQCGPDEDPYSFALRQMRAVAVIAAQMWWLRLQGNGHVSAHQDLRSHAVVAALRVFRDGLRRGGPDQHRIALLGRSAAANVVKALCFARQASERPWMLVLAKHLRA